MGARGPVPVRSDQRRRKNKPEDGLTPTSAPGAVLIEQPKPDPTWHELARDWYVSLGTSGQAVFYQPSDWHTARVWADLLSRQLLSSRPSAQMVAAWASAATELLTTEGARRRVRIELERPKVDEDEEASVTALKSYRDRLKA